MGWRLSASYKFTAMTFTGKCSFLKLHLIQEKRKLVSKVGRLGEGTLATTGDILLILIQKSK